MKADIQEDRMRLYLLGDLPESEANSLAQELFVDDEKFEQMWEIENSLVEGYIRGRLSSKVRERFERYYLASPVHRRRVAVARNLIEKADRLKAEAAMRAPRLSLQTRLFEMLGISPASVRFALTAAVLLLAVGSLWLVFDRAQWRNEIEQLKAESEARRSHEQALADQIAAARGESEKQTAEIERLRAERDAIERRLGQTTQAPPLAIFSSLLSPVLIRGGGNPQVLTIPPRTDVVRLQMRADLDDAKRRFQVTLRTEGRQVWKQRAIKPQFDGANAVITVHIPADKLALGDYILTLSTVNPRGKPDELDGYYFRVIRQ